MASRLLAVLLLAAQASHQASAANPQKVDLTAVKYAACSFDVIQAALHIYKAGLQVDSAVISCKDVKAGDTPRERSCAVDITGLVNSFLGVGAFLAAAATNCDMTTNQEAACAATIVGTIGGIAGVANSAAGIAASCATLGGGRRLEAANATAVAGAAERRLEPAPIYVAWCILDVLMVTANLGRAGNNIAASTVSCTELTPASCSAGVSGTVAAVANVASYLSGAAAHCAAGLTVTNKEAGCAGDVTHLVNELAGLASSGSAMSEACNFGAADQGDSNNVIGNNRRLAPLTNSGSAAEAFAANIGDLLPRIQAAAKEGPAADSMNELLPKLRDIADKADKIKEAAAFVV